MRNTNVKVRALIELLEPSAIGTIIYIVIFVCLIIANQFSRQKDLFQSVSVDDFKGTFLFTEIRDFRNITFSHTFSNISLYIMWAVIGILVYTISYSIIRNVQEVYDDVNVRHYIWPRNADADSPLREYLEKLLFRIGIVIVALVYLIKGIPFIHSWWASRDPVSTLNERMIINYIYLFIIVFVYLQILTILIRLFLLRKRNIS